jgi:anti-sigma factor RsiW
MWLLGGHLGGMVSALVDGQLEPPQAERAWTHVLACASCRAGVEHEVWVKNELASLASTEPPAGLVEAIDRLARDAQVEGEPVAAAWATVGELERRHRLRRVGLVAVGAGSVSAAMLGLGAVSGTLDIKEPRPAGAVVGRDRPATPVVLPGGRPVGSTASSGSNSVIVDLLAPAP